MTHEELLQIIEKAAKEKVTELDLFNKYLSSLPPEICQLSNLTLLELSYNQLISLPLEICQLSNLTSLSLHNNQLVSLPSEIYQLSKLTKLSLHNNQLVSLPLEICQLSNLTSLSLSRNQLISLPSEIYQLSNLTLLELFDNQLVSLPSEICQLSKLTELSLSDNQLVSLPSEIYQLSNLKKLHLSNNQLSCLPPEICQLFNLTELYLNDNKLSSLPPEISQLSNLRWLYLHENQLSTLPPKICEFSNLTRLYLDHNKLSTLPPEISQLSNLTTLFLDKNQLRSLPPEIGQLANLTTLYLDNNPLTSPPPEIIEQGTQAILTYLQEKLEDSQRQWVSKLLVVGEGGVGKTSLLRALRGEEFDTQESTTHGIEIKSLPLTHPAKPDVTMQLNTWDFGGQEIYHATHQFFLTNRSLFLLAWNARLGFEQGKLYYWLDTIKALAPESPILLVATHIDERDADLPLKELRDKYPQIVEHCKISSKISLGIEELRQAIADTAAKLPLMGELWPTTWLNAANTIRSQPEKYITPQQLWKIMAESGVADMSQEVLARWLHELGEILYFQDNEELNDTVILKPQWVTEYISKVLESEEVINKFGIFTRQEMDKLWQDLAPSLRDHFLRLMERFDLSYRTLENRDISLIVERLPFDPPNYEQQWQQIKAKANCHEISMKFKLNTIPAGIPTWFIARQHRFTTNTHWRNGALLAYEQEHLALVEAAKGDRYIKLTVRGANPLNFFVLLRDGIEVTLSRFPGLDIQRTIPCLGHNGEPCTHEFDYHQLSKRWEKKKSTIECPEAIEDVSVAELLYGLNFHTQNAVLERIDELETKVIDKQATIIDEIKNLRELSQREFTNIFRREQAKIDSHCPNIFVLRPRTGKSWQKALAGQKIDLQLYCQAPGCWHPTQTGGLYEIDEPAKWLRATAPYIGKLFKVLRFAAPIIGPWLGVVDPKEYEAIYKNDLELFKELAEKLPEIQDAADLELADKIARGEDLDPERADGAALRALRQLLEEKDPQQHWGGLKKVLTPEGHYLWLCEHHAAEYKR
ncbi:leucine-rich repeat domain-containing protein [Nostoc sp. FACHB-87]|uniref:COR domain-containing protein n=1 Tax=Nostocaceae TaxID=1162 RepID=UPI001687E065|nr:MULTISPECIES: COR domain-containing protein [Nostocaceae]MBD2457821.1 leucine-rich repeat domain-containing protein [Nostoc sp. FACHB-87]MBD2479047.1 leucine-rich repeat domain-containing protein [Anabaena sp. FACHB-83]